MYLDTIIPTEEGWLIGGSWQAPPNWLGSNPASPPKYELIIEATWDGIAAPAIEVVHIGGEGVIHGLFETEDGYLATGTSDTYLISERVLKRLGSRAELQQMTRMGMFGYSEILAPKLSQLFPEMKSQSRNYPSR